MKKLPAIVLPAASAAISFVAAPALRSRGRYKAARGRLR